MILFIGLILFFFRFKFIKKKFLIDLNLLNKDLLNIIFFIDWLSISFCSFLLIIRGTIFLFGKHYMKKKIIINRFFFILSLFIISMLLLILLFSNFFWLLVGWDGLGVTSVLLILFYQAKRSFSSSIKTFLIKRLGDGFLIVSLIKFFVKGKFYFIFDNLIRVSFFFFFFFFYFKKK